MRAVVITHTGGPEVLDIQNVEMLEPVGDQVRVRVRAAGLNRADLAQRMGGYPALPGVPSNIPGLEFAGVVDAVGPLVQLWKLGQRVMGITGGGDQDLQEFPVYGGDAHIWQPGLLHQSLRVE